MRNIISAEQYLRFRDAIAEQLRHFSRQAGGFIGEVDDNENRIVAAGASEGIYLLVIGSKQIPLARRDGRVIVAHGDELLVEAVHGIRIVELLGGVDLHVSR